MSDDFTTRKAEAAAWFRTLRDRIVGAFEDLERQAATNGEAPVAFEVTPTSRANDGGGGIMSVLRGGKVFEKVGVNWSQVHGVLGERAQKAMAATRSFGPVASHWLPIWSTRMLLPFT